MNQETIRKEITEAVAHNKLIPKLRVLEYVLTPEFIAEMRVYHKQLTDDKRKLYDKMFHKFDDVLFKVQCDNDMPLYMKVSILGMMLVQDFDLITWKEACDGK